MDAASTPWPWHYSHQSRPQSAQLCPGLTNPASSRFTLAHPLLQVELCCHSGNLPQICPHASLSPHPPPYPSSHPLLQVELCCRIAVLLLRLHQPQLTCTPSARAVLLQLQRRLRGSVQGLKDVMGFNTAAAAHLMLAVRQRSSVEAGDSIALAKRALAQAAE